uniref:BTB domain-containing protein n=1 Tax=Arcella intermedia TaxID=1963864 RepID=A0A6B2LTH0_9EUKA
MNVGGNTYQTSKTTLLKTDSFFTTLFSGRYNIEKDETGAIMIDRDGTHFGIILNFLRDSILPSELPRGVIEALLAEAKFYQLNALVQVLEVSWKGK